jgi:DtxR family transcriptional regulator, Mn-dependent transcriptional regulator
MNQVHDVARVEAPLPRAEEAMPIASAAGIASKVGSLGLGIDAVHAEADRLEHALSDELEARIDKALGYPTHDPHGDPIPDAKLRLKSTRLRTLADLEPGERSTVQRVPDGDVELLRYLATLELLPGEQVELRRSAPFGGPLAVGVRGTEHAISRELANQISVA